MLSRGVYRQRPNSALVVLAATAAAMPASITSRSSVPFGFCPRRHEVHVVEQPLAADAFEPREFGQRIGVIVDPQAPPPDIPRWSRSRCRRLLAALVTAFGLPGFHRGDQPAGERFSRRMSRTRARLRQPHQARPACCRRPTPRSAPHGRTSRCSARRCAPRCRLWRRGRETGAARRRVGLGHVIDHRLRGHPLAQQAHPAITPERVRQRLRRKRADAAFAVRTDRADREELARHRNAEGAAGSRAMMDHVMAAL